MSEAIKPALTAEEWQLREAYPAHLGDAGGDDRRAIVVDRGGAHQSVELWESGLVTVNNEYPIVDARHALAAICLYNQPFGFTREDVAALRQIPSVGFETNFIEFAPGLDWERRIEALADRIEALLPPE